MEASARRNQQGTTGGLIMNKQILEVVEAVSNEKGVAREIIFEALEAALASATRRKHGDDIDVRVEIDRKTGEYSTFRRWKVFADDSTELEFPERELRLRRCGGRQPQGRGERVRRGADESVAFGRIAAQTAKQVIVQKVREAERAQVVDEYKDRVSSLVSGIVKRVDRHGVYVDLGGNAEGFVPREHMIPREMVRPQDRLKALLREVRSEARGPPAFPVADLAGIPDRTLQARSTRGRAGADPDPGCCAGSGCARQDCREEP